MHNSTGPAAPDNGDEALAGAMYMVAMGARVLPVARGTKRALLRDWGKQASNDPDEVRAWAEWYPNCNWGMVCDRLAVLDVDRHPNTPDGHAALAAIEAEHGKIQTWAVHTPQGGKHLYFDQPKDKVRNLKRDDSGLEIKGDGGYVLLPGSSTPHGAYQWDSELHPDNIPRTVLPAYVRDFMKGNGKGNGPSWNMEHTPRECSSVPGHISQESADNESGHLKHPQLPKTALAEWFEAEVPEGGRNHALARGVGLMAAAGTPKPVAEAAAKWWCRHRCQPPLIGPEVGRTFESIFKAEARRRITESGDAADSHGLIVHPMREFTALDIPPRRHVLRPVLPQKGLVQLFAPRGVGKSYTALAMAYAVATAGTFLRWSAPESRSVLYVDAEMPAEMQERMRRLVAAHDGVYPADLKILSMDQQEARTLLNLASELDQALIEQIEAEVIFLDNRSTLVHGGRENDAESWDAMQQWLLKLRRIGKTVLLVDHAGRGGFAARGTSKREDVLDTIIHLKRPSDYESDEGARFEVHLEKARGVFGDDAKPFEARLETVGGADHWHVKSLEDANADRVIEATKEGLSSREIAKELGVSHSTVNRIRRRNKFTVIEGGKDVEHGTPPKGVFQRSSEEEEGDGP